MPFRFNKNQKKAIERGSGPILIVAGAGTGKTAVIAGRISHLIEKGMARPDEILALTFTEKAAQEMEDRVSRTLSESYMDLWISTFHSFCERVLRNYGLDIGLPIGFKVADQTGAWTLARKNIEKFPLDYYKPIGRPTKFIHALLNHFSRCKDQAILPKDYLLYAESVRNAEDCKRIKEAARSYDFYEKLLLNNDLLDFGGLINYCLRLFKERPRILEIFRKKFKYILVDEFQDTNWAQYELVKMLAAPANNLFVCADDDQAIYRWRGASFGNILLFKKDFPRAEEIALTENYRSPQNILDLAYKFIQLNNPNRLECVSAIKKRLKSQTKKIGIIEFQKYKTIEEEAHSVANKIKQEIKKDRGLSFKNFAVLARTNNSANFFSRALERAGIPFNFLSYKGLYSQPIILDVIAYFKLLDNYHENSAVFRVLSFPFLKIEPSEIAKITQYGKRKCLPVFETLKALAQIPGISNRSRSEISKLLDLIKKHSELAKQKNVSEVFIAFLRDSGYLEFLAKQGESSQLSSISRFFEKIQGFESSNVDLQLRNFIEELNFELESGETGSIEQEQLLESDTVKVMTVHGAKGLEFDYIFLVDLVDKRFPTQERSDPIELPQKLIKDIIPSGDAQLEEERRLFYVGITRAKKGLFFSASADCGGARLKKISRFLAELGFKDEIAGVALGEPRFSNEAKKKAGREKQILAKNSLPPYFSYTQLKDFSQCPLLYKFKYIFRIPSAEKPFLLFGKVMHKALFRFVSESRSKKIDIKELMRIYKTQWISEWYESKKQEEQYFKLGEKSLRDFYKTFSKEKPQVLLINGQPALELMFSLKIGEYLLKGKIDRIDLQKNGGVEIMDYKTGSAKEKITGSDKDQLLIYQIAAEEIFGLKPARLVFYYLDQNKKVGFESNERNKEAQKQKVVSQIERLKKSEFEARPGRGCHWCDYKNICEFSQR